MIDDSLLPFSLPSVDRKKITAAFDGGRISSDGGVMLLALAERRMGIADKLAAEITDRREPTRVIHALSDILRARILAIACGYEDADDLDYLRSDPALKLACGQLPEPRAERSCGATVRVISIHEAGLVSGCTASWRRTASKAMWSTQPGLQ